MSLAWVSRIYNSLHFIVSFPPCAVVYFWKYLECTDTNTGLNYNLKVQRDWWCHLIGLYSRVRCGSFTEFGPFPHPMLAFLRIRNDFIRIPLSRSLRARLRVRILCTVHIQYSNRKYSKTFQHVKDFRKKYLSINIQKFDRFCVRKVGSSLDPEPDSQHSLQF